MIRSCFDSHDCFELWSKLMRLSCLSRNFHIWTLVQPSMKQVRFAVNLMHHDALNSQVEPWLKAIQSFDSPIRSTSCFMKFQGKFSEKLHYDP